MQLARFIDHTLLKNTTTTAEVETLCGEAMEYGFAAVCVPPYYVDLAKTWLMGTSVKVATVIGFPLGYQSRQVKSLETDTVLAAGVDEIDVVMNLAAFKDNHFEVIHSEIEDIIWVISARKHSRTLKVIIESGILTDEEIIRCCELFSHYPIQFLKTSTGFAEKGASVHAVELMRKHLPRTIQIKASGGIKTAAFAEELIRAGATRIGTSSGVALVTGSQATSGY